MKVIQVCALPKEREVAQGRRLCLQGLSVTPRSKWAQGEKMPFASMVIPSGWGSSNLTPPSACNDCAWACQSDRSSPTDRSLTRKFISWSGDWPAAVYWNTALAPRRTARIRSSSSRKFPITGHSCRKSAMPMSSCCRVSRICGGEAMKWSWNRRAPVRCFEFTIRRLQPQSQHCLRRNKSKDFVDGIGPHLSNFFPC